MTNRVNSATSKFIFSISYIIFFVSLFLDDMAFNMETSIFVKSLKVITVFCLLACSVSKTWEKKSFIEYMIGILIGLIILFCTGDFFFLIIILLGFNSIDITDNAIFRLAFHCCFIMLIISQLLYQIGILSDIISYRTDFNIEARHSFGFSHSTVFPLIVLYMFVYYIAEKKEKSKYIVIAFFMIIEFILYQFCMSRNALVGCFLVSIGVLMIKNKYIKSRIRKRIQTIARWIPLMGICFSILPGYFRYKEFITPFWNVYDTIFTNRSLLLASAIDGYGIHIINTMSYLEYSNLGVNVDSYVHYGLVLDSAYTYVLIRYGVLTLIFLYNILLAFYKKEKENEYMCILYIVIILINMTDNDIMSYGCLPILLIGLKNIWNKRFQLR